MSDKTEHPGASQLDPDEGRAAAAAQEQQRADQAHAAYAESGGAEQATAPNAEDSHGAAGPVEDEVDEAAELAARAAEDQRTREELFAAWEEAQRQRDDFLGHLQRVQAEFENFRKRSMREGAAQRDAGKAELVTRLLDVLDDFDMAVLSVDKTEDVASLHKGLELVYAKFRDVLKGAGVEKIDETGVPFDPEKHEAVQHEPGDGEQVVAEVFRPGYTMAGRTLRAAMVKVQG